MPCDPSRRLPPEQIARLAYSAGVTDPARLATAVAIAMAESCGGDPLAVGDTALVNETWGPSVGLWQIRSVKAQTGTGQPRDVNRLTDPTFNARSMVTIAGDSERAGRSPWYPWTVYKEGTYRTHLNAATAAANAVLAGTSGGGSSVGVSTPWGGVQVGGGGFQADLPGIGSVGIGGVDNAVGALIDSITSPLDFLRTLARFLFDPAFWRRVGLGAAGVVLVLAGAVIVARDVLGVNLSGVASLTPVGRIAGAVRSR